MVRTRIARAVALSRLGRAGKIPRVTSIASGARPCWATKWMRVPSKRKTVLVKALHSRCELSAMASNTGWTSVGELEMTRKISLVAVCCSRASVTWAWASVRARFFCCSSVKSRAFSIAMTAWSAKVRSSSTCRSENISGSTPDTLIAPMGRPSRSMGTDKLLRNPTACAQSRSAYWGSLAASGT